MKLYLVFLIQVQYNTRLSTAHYSNYYPPDEMDYEEMSYRTKHGQSYMNSGGMPYGDDYDMRAYDSEECDCVCNQCDMPKPCCRQICSTSCNQPMQPVQPNVVYLPYPFPLVIKEKTTTEPPTSTTTTPPTTTKQTPRATTESTTTTVEETFVRMLPAKSGDGKIKLTTLRKTKPSWRPKYGIVPIPDHLAETLMSQLRHMRNINSP